MFKNSCSNPLYCANCKLIRQSAVDSCFFDMQVDFGQNSVSFEMRYGDTAEEFFFWLIYAQLGDRLFNFQ